MHKLLLRQLKRLKLKSTGAVEFSVEKWAAFLQAISESYEQADVRREMIDHTLTLVSTELTERNHELKEHLEKIEKNQELIHFQAHHDALTELPNRIYFMDRLEHAIKVAERKQSLVAILFIDLDHFKKINDTCGHKKGDELLCMIAERMSSCARCHDTLSRFGGDEFVILLEDLSTFAVAITIATRLLEAIARPSQLDLHQFHISASIGVSIYPRDDLDPQELIRKADMAMYHAKDKGRNNFQFFNKPLERLALHQIDVESRLRKAIVSCEFELLYQPKVATPHFDVVGFEALIRWYPAGQKPVSPLDFIPVAEKTGLIKEIGDWVIEETCQQIRTWLDKGYTGFTISVNISATELLETNLTERVRNHIEHYRIPPEMLEIEITETVLMKSLSDAQKTLTEIRQLGLSISLDDFGTGYSSLRYLQNLPLDYLKIDKVFVQNLNSDVKSNAIVLSIISLGHNLGLKVVGEGAEDLEVAEALSKYKCDLIQGYYFHKPLTVQDAERLLKIQ